MTRFGTQFGRRFRLCLRATVLGLLGLLAGAPAPLGANDYTFVLTHGGRVRGHWENVRDRRADRYRVQLPQGGRVVLEKTQVQQTIRHPDALRLYERLAPAVGNTVDDHWRVAEWCRANRLEEQRAVHLECILALDTDHAPARRGLGYSQVKGQWVLREEELRRRGYVRFEDRWRTPQEVQLMKERETRTRKERQWSARLADWREDLDSARGPEVARQIRAIRDPYAVPALGDYLRREPFRAVKMLYIEALGQIASGDAIAALIISSLHDPDEEIFHACIVPVIEHKLPETTEAYVKALNDVSNERVNRAAHVLGKLDDSSAITPLIEALTTTHRIVIPGRNGASPDAVTATFASPDASGNLPVSNGFEGTGLTSGDDSKTISRTVANQEVLTALVRLSGGASFGFNQQAWRTWQAVENRRTRTVNLRGE